MAFQALTFAEISARPQSKSFRISPDPGSVSRHSFSSANLLVLLRITDRRNRPFCALIWQVEREKHAKRVILVSQIEKAVDPRDTNYEFGRDSILEIGWNMPCSLFWEEWPILPLYHAC
jgi:hypothetical protein